MNGRWIKNFDKLASTENRKIALQIIEAGIDAINTERRVASYIKLVGEYLQIGAESFDLSKFSKIKVVGFGKSSPFAARALEKILGDKITEGAVIGIEKLELRHIESFIGTHPKPSESNLAGSKRICEIAENSKEDELVIVLVSGGGSALLCYPDEECKAGEMVYEGFLKSGGTISEMNTVRKHISMLKGGGLAKFVYPATLIGLIFSDVPGDIFYDVASGPTYKDETTVSDAENIVKEKKLGSFNLIETPKEDKYFKKIHNFVLVSNKTAVEAMREKSIQYGLNVRIASYDLYDEASSVLQTIFSFSRRGFWRKLFGVRSKGEVVLAAGEPSIAVKKNTGKGGRNTHLSLSALKDNIKDEQSVFIPFASDGLDNSDAAGGIADMQTLQRAEKMNLNLNQYIENFDSYTFFEKTDNLIFTGPTGANVSDLMILLKKK